MWDEYRSHPMNPQTLQSFFTRHLTAVRAEALAEAREKVATALMQCSLATGHGDTLDDLLIEMRGQVRTTHDRIATVCSVVGQTQDCTHVGICVCGQAPNSCEGCQTLLRAQGQWLRKIREALGL
jgi:hypothetical protein